MSEVNSVSMGPNDGGAKQEFDQVRAEKAVTELLHALGEDPSRDGLKDTPKRVAKALAENFAGLWQKPKDVLTTTFDIGHKELVIVREIEVFFSLRASPNAFSWRSSYWLYPWRKRKNYWNIKISTPC